MTLYVFIFQHKNDTGDMIKDYFEVITLNFE